MFNCLRKSGISDQIIHDLTLKEILQSFKYVKNYNYAFELSDSNQYFDELANLIKISSISKKTINLRNKLILMHLPSEKLLLSTLNKLRAGDSITLLVHNKNSLDYLIEKIIKIFVPDAKIAEGYFSSQEIDNLLKNHVHKIEYDSGSCLVPKSLLLILPDRTINLLLPLINNVEASFAQRFKAFTRNRIIVLSITSWSETKQKNINSEYAKMSLEFDSLYNLKTPQGKSYFRNVKRLLNLMATKPNEKILDIGIGTGTYSILLAKQGANVVGFDISSEMLEIARTKSKKSKVKLKLVRGDAEDLPFKYKEFDKIVSASVPHDVGNFNRFIFECSRCLKKNGKLYLNIYNPFSLAGLVTYIKIKLNLHPKINFLPLSYVKSICAHHGLKFKKKIGIELFQGIPIPWSLKWKLTDKFSDFEKNLSASKFNWLFSQFIIEFEKI